MELSDLGLLVLRAWVGVVMISHGINHARSLDRTARWFGRLGWRAPRYQAWLSSVVEIVIGVGLVVGLMTTLATAGVAATMLVAYFTHHRRNGFFIFNKGEGYEYVITLAVAAAAMGFLGAGGWSLDRTLEIDPSGADRVLILVAVLGLGGAHVAALWRPDRAKA